MTAGVKDSGWSDYFRKLIEETSRSITVGIHEDETDREIDSDFKTNAEIGYIHEFGLGVPRRSFLREPFESNHDRLVRMQQQIFKAAAVGQIAPSSVLPLIGESAVSLLKNNIRDGISPPLSPTTVALKKSSTPLIDTGQLLNSIDYQVEK